MSRSTAASLAILAVLFSILAWRLGSLRIELHELRRDHEALINVLGEREFLRRAVPCSPNGS